jgi:hypothetical protein
MRLLEVRTLRRDISKSISTPSHRTSTDPHNSENPHTAHSTGLGDGRVVEPHTGLPMNVGKYGDGAGGTDASRTVHGLHGHEAGAGAGAGSTTDWNAVRKADTPY